MGRIAPMGRWIKIHGSYSTTWIFSVTHFPCIGSHIQATGWPDNCTARIWPERCPSTCIATQISKATWWWRNYIGKEFKEKSRRFPRKKGLHTFFAPYLVMSVTRPNSLSGFTTRTRMRYQHGETSGTTAQKRKLKKGWTDVAIRT